LEIADSNGSVIRTFTAKPGDENKDETPILGDDDRQLETSAGLNRFVWNMRYASAEKFDKLILWNNSLKGAQAIPGMYQATLSVGDEKQTVSIELLPDPRLDSTPADYQAQYDFVSGINQKLTEAHQAITHIREIKSQLVAIEKRLEDTQQFTDLLKSSEGLKKTLGEIESTLYQTKMESPQDPLNFPIRLNDKLAGLMSLTGYGDHAPSAAAIAVRDELVGAVDLQLQRLEKLIEDDLKYFNQQAADAGLTAIGM